MSRRLRLDLILRLINFCLIQIIYALIGHQIAIIGYFFAKIQRKVILVSVLLRLRILILHR